MVEKMTRKGRGRGYLFHIPGSGINITLEDLLNGDETGEVEVIEPATNRPIGLYAHRDLLRKFG